MGGVTKRAAWIGLERIRQADRPQQVESEGNVPEGMKSPLPATRLDSLRLTTFLIPGSATIDRSNPPFSEETFRCNV